MCQTLYREEAPLSLAELIVKYRLDADGLLLKDLVAERDFLAQRLGIPEHLLPVLSWEAGSIVITFWILRDVLPLAELALCRKNVRADLIEHSVVDVYLDSYYSVQPGSVSSSECSMDLALCLCSILYMVSLPPSLQVDLSLQTVHRKEHTFVSYTLCLCEYLHIGSIPAYMLYVIGLFLVYAIALLFILSFVYLHVCVVQRRAIVTVLDAHRQDMDITTLTSDLQSMGIMTTEQCQKLANLDEEERRHEALLYTLLACDGPDTYHKLVECMGRRYASIGEDLQGVLMYIIQLRNVLVNCHS